LWDRLGRHMPRWSLCPRWGLWGRSRAFWRERRKTFVANCIEYDFCVVFLVYVGIATMIVVRGWCFRDKLVHEAGEGVCLWLLVNWRQLVRQVQTVAVWSVPSIILRLVCYWDDAMWCVQAECNFDCWWILHSRYPTRAWSSSLTLPGGTWLRDSSRVSTKSKLFARLNSGSNRFI
jgi:hypothetical protein